MSHEVKNVSLCKDGFPWLWRGLLSYHSIGWKHLWW